MQTGDMPETSTRSAQLEQRVLRALANARTERMHFAYFFVNPSLVHAGGGQAVVELNPDPELLNAQGECETGALLLALDFALTVALQAAPGERRRIATAGLHLGFSGAPLTGPLRIAARAGETLSGTAAPMARAEAEVMAGGRTLLRASGLYMRFPDPDTKPALEGLVHARSQAPLSGSQLDESERSILRRSKRLQRAGDERFAERLWGYRGHKAGEAGARAGWRLGPHVLNRYGAAHGGLLCGLAAASAVAAVPGRNRILEFSASFVSPGTGERLGATSRAIHVGRRSATVRSAIRAPGGRPVLETLSVHDRAG